MLFKLDENLPSSLVELFASANHDAITVVAQDLQGQSDANIVEVCARENRVLVTLDKGFADIRTYPPAEYPGFIVLRLRHQEVPYIRATISKVLRLMVDYPVQGTLWIVEDDRVRFRR